MKNNLLKNYALLSFGICLLAISLFAGQKFVSADTLGDNLTEPAITAETRCGWILNPTPANWWLNDRDGEWTISVQGGYQATGADLPDFGKRWVVTNAASYGYGCACMNVTTDKNEMRILNINKVTVRPLSACRKDKKLKEPKD